MFISTRHPYGVGAATFSEMSKGDGDQTPDAITQAFPAVPVGDPGTSTDRGDVGFTDDGSCVDCGAVLDARQQYCLECGAPSTDAPPFFGSPGGRGIPVRAIALGALLLVGGGAYALSSDDSLLQADATVPGTAASTSSEALPAFGDTSAGTDADSGALVATATRTADEGVDVTDPATDTTGAAPSFGGGDPVGDAAGSDGVVEGETTADSEAVPAFGDSGTADTGAATGTGAGAETSTVAADSESGAVPAFGESGSTETDDPAVDTASPGTDSSAATGDDGGAAADDASGDEWSGGTAYTVLLSSATSQSAASAFRDRVRATGRSAGVLVSANHSGLRAGYYVVFSGVYPSRAGAIAAARTLASRYPGANARKVVG